MPLLDSCGVPHGSALWGHRGHFPRLETGMRIVQEIKCAFNTVQGACCSAAEQGFVGTVRGEAVSVPCPLVLQLASGRRGNPGS